MNQEGNVWSDVPTLLAAAHELKSPLVLMRQLALELQTAGENQIAERIQLTAERSLQLVEGLTRVARMDDAMFELEPIYLPSLYDEIAHELQPLARALGQTIQVSTRASNITAIGNRQLLRSVMLGLCDNALTHNASSREVIVGAHRRGDRVIASVRDFGPATSSLRDIRHSVGRTVQPVADRPRSSGLGLMIAQQFARHMDAELLLCRHRGSGATFSLSLPASQQLALFG